MIERLLELARARGCQAAEAYVVKTTRTPVEFENNRLKLIQTTTDGGVAVRVFKDGRIGFATSTRATSDPGALLDNALAVAAFGAEASFALPGPAALPAVRHYDPSIPALDPQTLVDQGQVMVDAVRAYDPKVMAMAQVQRGEKSVRLVNSAGFDGSYTATHYVIACGGMLVEPENFLMAWDYMASARRAGDPEAIAGEVVRKLRLGRTNVKIKSGLYPTILTPAGLAACLGTFLACANGQSVHKGTSPWRDRLGTQVASPAFTLYDDPLLEDGFGSVPFDDEGVPAARVAIIEAGVLTSFLHDLRSASALHTAPTGHGRREELSAQPTIGTSNLVVKRGDSSFAAMVAGLKEGVIVDQLMGAWSGNPYSGQINGNIELGYKVENGEITGRIKDCMFSVNAFEVFRDHVEAISSELRPAWPGVLPYVLLSAAGINSRS